MGRFTTTNKNDTKQLEKNESSLRIVPFNIILKRIIQSISGSLVPNAGAQSPRCFWIGKLSLPLFTCFHFLSHPGRSFIIEFSWRGVFFLAALDKVIHFHFLLGRFWFFTILRNQIMYCKLCMNSDLHRGVHYAFFPALASLSVFSPLR